MPDLIDRKQISARIADQWYLWEDKYDIDQVLEDIQSAPAVEAIPVEWVKAFAEKNKNHIQDSVNKYTYMYDFLISEWRAEHETH